MRWPNGDLRIAEIQRIRNQVGYGVEEWQGKVRESILTAGMTYSKVLW